MRVEKPGSFVVLTTMLAKMVGLNAPQFGEDLPGEQNLDDVIACQDRGEPHKQQSMFRGLTAVTQTVARGSALGILRAMMDLFGTCRNGCSLDVWPARLAARNQGKVPVR